MVRPLLPYARVISHHYRRLHERQGARPRRRRATAMNNFIALGPLARPLDFTGSC